MTGAHVLSQSHAMALLGLRVVDVTGVDSGRVESVLVDREDGVVAWLHVRLAGLIGAFVAMPLGGLTSTAGVLRSPWPHTRLEHAPRVPADGGLTSRQERALCDHFSLTTPTRGASLSTWERRRTAARLLQPGVWDPAPRGPGLGRVNACAPDTDSIYPLPRDAPHGNDRAQRIPPRGD